MSTQPEFDSYAAEYAAGMENPIKAKLGASADAFVAIKLRWLLREMPHLRRTGETFHILDYGCGIATLLRLMAEQDIKASLIGCDVSSHMLREAEGRWPVNLPAPELIQQIGAHVPLPDQSVDLVVISAVLHHVPPEDRPQVYAELHRLLTPKGRIVVFEHNPLNPITRYVVAHTPIDQYAILLRSSEVQSALRQQQFKDIRTNYLMFLPPRLKALAAFEDVIRWLPLGAQYAVTAHR